MALVVSKLRHMQKILNSSHAVLIGFLEAATRGVLWEKVFFLQPQAFIRKETLAQVFSCEFYEI